MSLTESELEKAIKESCHDESAHVIGIDDTFNFKCKQCGRCCMHRNDIILNPFDVYQGAKYLKMPTQDFIHEYLDVTLGSQSRIPMLLLKSKENGFCPFLEMDIANGCKFKCTIHSVKPGACANHPIGVVASQKIDDNTDVDYTFIKVDQCANSKDGGPVKVRDWCKAYLDNVDEVKIAHRLQTLVVNFYQPSDFNLLCKSIYDATDKDEVKKAMMDIVETANITTVGYGYIEYDTDKPFLKQAQENLEKLSSFYENTKELFERMKTMLHIPEGMSVKDFLSNETDNLKEEKENGNN